MAVTERAPAIVQISQQNKAHLMYIYLAVAFDYLLVKWLFIRFDKSMKVLTTGNPGKNWCIFIKKSLQHKEDRGRGHAWKTNCLDKNWRS